MFGPDAEDAIKRRNASYFLLLIRTLFASVAVSAVIIRQRVIHKIYRDFSLDVKRVCWEV